MKRLLTLLLAVMLAAAALACTKNKETDEPDEPVGGEMIAQGEADTLPLRVVDGAQSGTLVLAGERAGDVYTLPLEGVTLYLDGSSVDASATENGMVAEVWYSGAIEETFPARFGSVVAVSFSSETGESGVYDLCGLYLQVLEDLWEKDSGLNADVSFISVDLGTAPGKLTEGEKSAIAWIFADRHEAEMLTLSYEELIDAGYLTKSPNAENDRTAYSFANGLLFSIMPFELVEQPEGTTVSFSAQKWRSPLGAFWLDACTATCTEDGRWNGYSIGAEMIS